MEAQGYPCQGDPVRVPLREKAFTFHPHKTSLTKLPILRIETRLSRPYFLHRLARDGPLSEGFVNELLAIDAIKREIHQMHDRPV